MKRGMSFFHFSGGLIAVTFLLFLLGTGASGCGAVSSDVHYPKPVVCTPQAANANIYRTLASGTIPPGGSAPMGGTSGVTTNLSVEEVIALLQGTPAPVIPVTGAVDSYDAILGVLVQETQKWSDVQTIKLDATNTAQIIVTFLSPQLIQAMYYSQVASQGASASNPQAVLDAIAARDELIFFVTVIATTNNNINTTPHSIRIPIQSMIIMNADDVETPPLHDDHILAQPINSSYEPVYGYLTYPIAMLHGTNCKWILNPDYNKRIIITVPHIYVDEKSVGSYTWDISYSSLFKVETPSSAASVTAVNQNLITTSVTPPPPKNDLLVSGSMDENTFWQAYAGFLWKQVLKGIY